MKLRSKSVPPAIVSNRVTRSRKTRIIQSYIQSIDSKVIEPSMQGIRTRSKLSLSKIDDLKNKTKTNRNEMFSAEKGMLNEPDSVSVTLSKDENRTRRRLRSNQIPPVESSTGTNTACTQTANDETNNNGDVQKNKSIKLSVISEDEIRSKKRLSRSEKCSPVAHQQDNNAVVSSTYIQRSRPIRLKNVQATSFEDRASNKQKTENRISKRTEMKRSGNYQIGDIVLVKWPSYPFWPARITSINDKKVNVEFFGDDSRIAAVKEDRIYDYHTNNDYIVQTLKSRQWKAKYMKPIREVEIFCGIPIDVSIINQIPT